jgi:hypothetical protein
MARSIQLSFDGFAITRCVKGAWGNRTHSDYGTATVTDGSKVRDYRFEALRFFDREASSGGRVSYCVNMFLNGRTIREGALEDVRKAVTKAFRERLDASLKVY